MTIFERVFGLWSFSCASIGLEFKIKLCALRVVNVLIMGDIEKPSGLCIGLYV
jgi:hypothetical protein